jgi:hypothetical protein
MKLGLMDFISGIFKPAADLIDNMHTSTEEKMSMSNQLEKIQNAMTSKVLDLDAQLLASKTAIITAEANGQGFLQRNWRPVTMLTFLVLVVCDSFGLLAFRLADEAWTLLQLGLGGYVIGRSVEKAAKPIIDAVKK